MNVTWVVIVVSAVVGLLLATGEGNDLIAGLTGRGRRVGPRTSLNGAHVVVDESGAPWNPYALAEAATLDVNVYAMARMTSSEEGSSGAVVKRAIAWAVRNHAGGRDHVIEVLLRGSGVASGVFARQDAGGKYASTAQDPYEDDVAVATDVLSAGDDADPTRGATNFFAPSTQDVLHDRDPERYKTAEQVDAEWRAGGLEPVAVEGVDPEKLQFYRRA